MATVLRLASRIPHAKGILFHEDPARHRLLCGGLGSGKTCAMADELLAMAMRAANEPGPAALFGVFRKTGPALADYTWPSVTDAIPPKFIVDRRKSEGREDITIVGGTRVIARSLDDWRKIGGAEFDAEFIDEARDFSRSDANMLLGRRRGRKGPRRTVWATNPPTRRHFLHDWFVKGTEGPGFSAHHWSTFDNEANLPADYVEKLRGKEQTDIAWFKRFVLGEWGFTTDNQPVYREFDEETNTGYLEPERGGSLFLLAGWDFGFRRPAAVWGQILGNGWVNLLRELLMRDIDLRPFVRMFRTQSEMYFPNWPVIHYCDPAGVQHKDTGKPSIKVMREEGIRPRYRRLPLMTSVDCLQNLMRTKHLGRMQLMADRRYCPTFIEGALGGYYIDPETEEPTRDQKCEYRDVMDAGRYCVAPALMIPGSVFLAEPRGRRRERPVRPRLAV